MDFNLLNEITFSNKALFILYLLIAMNYLGTLFNCQIQYILTHSILVKHLFGVLSVYFFVILAEPTILEKGIIHNVMYTASIYIWFMMTLRMDAYLFLIVWVLFAVGMIFNEYANRMPKDSDAQKRLLYYSELCAKVSFIITILGYLIYLGEKKVEYGKDFHLRKFIFGRTKCMERTPEFAKAETFHDWLKFIGIALGIYPTRK